MASLYGLQLTQRIGNKNAVSTWQVFNSEIASTGFCQTFSDDFESRMLPLINAAQGSYVKNISLYTLNLTNGLCSYYKALTGEGDRATTESVIPPYFVTATVRWGVNLTQFGPREMLIKRGYTRLAGLLESDITSGQLDPSAVSTFLEPISLEWNDVVVLGGFNYNSVIHVPGTGNNPQWKVAQITDAQGWRVGTQNTRKQR